MEQKQVYTSKVYGTFLAHTKFFIPAFQGKDLHIPKSVSPH